MRYALSTALSSFALLQLRVHRPTMRISLICLENAEGGPEEALSAPKRYSNERKLLFAQRCSVAQLHTGFLCIESKLPCVMFLQERNIIPPMNNVKIIYLYYIIVFQDYHSSLNCCDVKKCVYIKLTLPLNLQVLFAKKILSSRTVKKNYSLSNRLLSRCVTRLFLFR